MRFLRIYFFNHVIHFQKISDEHPNLSVIIFKISNSFLRLKLNIHTPMLNMCGEECQSFYYDFVLTLSAYCFRC
jgi:hypothetical protein